MRTPVLLAVAALALAPVGSVIAQNSRGPVVPVTVRAVHVQVEAAAAAELKLDGSLEKLQQQALKDAQSQSPSVQRSFLLSTLTGYDAMAQTGRQVQVVTGRVQARDRVMEQTTNVQIGTILKVDPDFVERTVHVGNHLRIVVSGSHPAGRACQRRPSRGTHLTTRYPHAGRPDDDGHGSRQAATDPTAGRQ